MKKLAHTIEMPKALLNKWLKALRSGKLRQTPGTLLNTHTGGMCCLGVLEYCVTGSRAGIERDDALYEGDTTSPLNVPSREWLKEHGVRFRRIEASYVGGKLKRKITKWGHTAPGLYLDDDGLNFNDATNINDDLTNNFRHHYPFKAIADMIKRSAKGI